MGQESVQIRKHIDEERARLDLNIIRLERDFEVARNFFRDCLKNPLALIGIAIGIVVVVGNGFSRHRRKTS